MSLRREPTARLKCEFEHVPFHATGPLLNTVILEDGPGIAELERHHEPVAVVHPPLVTHLHVGRILVGEPSGEGFPLPIGEIDDRGDVPPLVVRALHAVTPVALVPPMPEPD